MGQDTNSSKRKTYNCSNQQQHKPSIQINHVSFSMQNQMLLVWESVAHNLNSVPRHGAGL
jgi:hypothetical protein